MKIQFLVFICAVVAVSGAEDGDAVVHKDHNKDAHHRLCNVMKAAVTKWGDGGHGLSEPLKKALGRTLFGNDDGGTVDTLKGKLPDDYDRVSKGSDSRSVVCGQPRADFGDGQDVHQPRWSGHSAPHDMVCLCTLGNQSWPLNKGNSDTLCGQDKTVLQGSTGQGWYDQDSGKEQLEATWDKVVKECLNNNGQGTNLKEALDKFKNGLTPKPLSSYPSTVQLGEGNATETDHDACDGSQKKGICVAYFPTMNPKPWWKDLEKAIPEEEKFQAQKQSEKEEKRREEEQANKKEEPRAEALSSTQTTTQGPEKKRTDTLHESMRKFNLTSGTPISRPSSWLLTVAALI